MFGDILFIVIVVLAIVIIWNTQIIARDLSEIKRSLHIKENSTRLNDLDTE